jgi:hypothetical protein
MLIAISLAGSGPGSHVVFASILAEVVAVCLIVPLPQL